MRVHTSKMPIEVLGLCVWSLSHRNIRIVPPRAVWLFLANTLTQAVQRGARGPFFIVLQQRRLLLKVRIRMGREQRHTQPEAAIRLSLQRFSALLRVFCTRPLAGPVGRH